MLHIKNKILILSLIFAINLKGNDKAAGAIIVSAIGDALGRVTEFLTTPLQIAMKYGENGVTSFASFHAADFIDGKALYTDDTLMAKILLEECIKAKQQNLSDDELISNYAKCCVALFGKQSMITDPYCYYRAHGPTNINGGQRLEAILELHEKNNKQESTDPQVPKKAPVALDSLWWQNNSGYPNIFYPALKLEGGCGSVMRAWPIALVFGDDMEKVKRLADKQSLLTHRHPMARAASCAIAAGVATALRNNSIEQIVQAMVKAAEQFDGEEKLYKPNAIKLEGNFEYDPTLIAQDKLLTSDMITYAFHMALQGWEPNAILGVHNKKQSNYRSPNGYLLGWAADEAVAAAVYVFVRHSKDIQSLLVEAVNMPGDSDSIAALGGALVGAYNGLEAFNKTEFNYSMLENKEELLALANKSSELIK